MGIDTGGFEPLELSLDCTSEQCPLETRCVGGLHDILVDFIQQPGDRGEEVWLQGCHILDDSKGGTGIVADAPPTT